MLGGRRSATALSDGARMSDHVAVEWSKYTRFWLSRKVARMSDYVAVE